MDDLGGKDKTSGIELVKLLRVRQDWLFSVEY